MGAFLSGKADRIQDEPRTHNSTREVLCSQVGVVDEADVITHGPASKSVHSINNRGHVRLSGTR